MTFVVSKKIESVNEETMFIIRTSRKKGNKVINDILVSER